MNNTPRTEQAASLYQVQLDDGAKAFRLLVSADDCRKIERELAAAKDELAEARKEGMERAASICEQRVRLENIASRDALHRCAYAIRTAAPTSGKVGEGT